MADKIENKIKNFFRKKKADAKFKLAGPGHKLSETSEPKERAPRKDAYRPPERTGLTDESKQAAAAALARFGGKSESPAFNTSLAAIRAQAKRELEAEKASTSVASSSQAQDDVVEENTAAAVNPENMAVSGVFFRCPLISDEVLSQQDWEPRIRDFLNEQLADDRGLTAVLMVYSLNKNKEKVQACVETLTKYLENILHNPSEEKYRKIRRTNKIYLEKVAPVEGAEFVLEGAGFVNEGEFFIFADPVTDEALQNVELLVDALKCAEPIGLELDRNLQVLVPSQAKQKQELPREFFRHTLEELKREQKARFEAIEKSSMLMTKAMREKEALRELRNYKYTLIRVRFNDGIMIQGTFGVYEPFTAVIDFIKESLSNPDLEFFLSTPLGEKYDNADETVLLELKLVPAVILIFNAPGDNHLRPEVVVLCQELASNTENA